MEKDLEKINYKKIDGMLNTISNLLVDIIDKRDLLTSILTKWRWNMPEIMIQWRTGGSRINRNIVILIENNGKSVNIECNAWLDQDVKKSLRIRKWYHKKIAKVKGFSEDLIKSKLIGAYDFVKSLRETDLTQKTRI